MTIKSVSLYAPLLICGLASAATVPFSEDFIADAANWRDGAGIASPAYLSSGGPDGVFDSFLQSSLNFVSSAAGDTPLFARAHDEYGSSGGAFVGDYLSEGVTEIRYSVRHSAPAPLTFFMRLASPANFPAVNAVAFAPILPNTWTELVISITPGNPAFVFEGPPSTFNSVFSNVGHLQIGVSVPAELAGLDQSIFFDFDDVTILPSGATVAVLLPFAAAVARRRR